MSTGPTNPAQAPAFSVLITVYNDWESLAGCLRAIGEQVDPPTFEVIVVDDGSSQTTPESVLVWQSRYPLRILREVHAGIPSARNRGVEESKGEILLFTDADCRFDANCLSELARTIAQSPRHSCFQLRLSGDCSTLLGRAEELRVIALQDQTLQPDGRIRLLNTAGFAILRSHTLMREGPFDPSALRGEDTLFLAKLMKNGELPLFVTEAKVRHSVALSIGECFRKDVRSGWLQSRTFRTIAAHGVRVRMRNVDRLRMLHSTWAICGEHSIGRAAWIVLVTRQLVERTVSVLFECWPSK